MSDDWFEDLLINAAEKMGQDLEKRKIYEVSNPPVATVNTPIPEYITPEIFEELLFRPKKRNGESSFRKGKEVFTIRVGTEMTEQHREVWDILVKLMKQHPLGVPLTILGKDEVAKYGDVAQSFMPLGCTLKAPLMTCYMGLVLAYSSCDRHCTLDIAPALADLYKRK